LAIWQKVEHGEKSGRLAKLDGGAGRISPAWKFLHIPPGALICDFTVLYWQDVSDQ
jgi:hypothetical protein